MATKQQVLDAHRNHPAWTARDIAEALGCGRGYVHNTARANGLTLPHGRSGRVGSVSAPARFPVNSDFRAQVENARPGCSVVYHRGPAGSAPDAEKAAARVLEGEGLCLLAQRFTGEVIEGDQRIFEYVAIRRAGS